MKIAVIWEGGVGWEGMVPAAKYLFLHMFDFITQVSKVFCLVNTNTKHAAENLSWVHTQDDLLSKMT